MINGVHLAAFYKNGYGISRRSDIIEKGSYMVKKGLSLILVLSLGLAFLWMAAPVGASSQNPQVFYFTPTPDANGRMIYFVQAGDTCISISLLTGVPLDDLRLLNDLSGEECLVFEGQELLLGIASEPTATPGPSPTPTSMLPTPTPFAGNAQVCVFLYEDINGNAMADVIENPLAGGAVSVTNREGSYSETQDTDDSGEPVCFDEVPKGDYNISVAVPDGFNPTTIVNYPLSVEAGDQALLNFGAQKKLEGQVEDPTGDDPVRNASPLLGILGGVLVLAGILLGIYARFITRSNNPLLR